jgi:hypothetical protein
VALREGLASRGGSGAVWERACVANGSPHMSARSGDGTREEGIVYIYIFQ